jgi:hypothetical protein
MPTSSPPVTLFDLLAQYSNLILVAVTSIYVILTMLITPAVSLTKRVWFHSTLLSGASEDFYLPGDDLELKLLASKYEKVTIDLRWLNMSSQKRNAHYEINFKEQLKGWYEAGWMTKPDDIPEQMENIKDELSKIRQALEAAQQERRRREQAEWRRHQKTLRYQISQRIKGITQRAWRVLRQTRTR